MSFNGCQVLPCDERPSEISKSDQYLVDCPTLFFCGLTGSYQKKVGLRTDVMLRARPPYLLRGLASFFRFCKDIEPGQMRVQECLEDNMDQPSFSTDCKEELDAIIEKRSVDFRWVRLESFLVDICNAVPRRAALVALLRKRQLLLCVCFPLLLCCSDSTALCATACPPTVWALRSVCLPFSYCRRESSAESPEYTPCAYVYYYVLLCILYYYIIISLVIVVGVVVGVVVIVVLPPAVSMM